MKKIIVNTVGLIIHFVGMWYCGFLGKTISLFIGVSKYDNQLLFITSYLIGFVFYGILLYLLYKGYYLIMGDEEPN